MSGEIKQERVVVKFETESTVNEVDAITAAKTMEAFATMMQEVYGKFDDNSKMLVKARPFSKGSFEIPLELIVIASAGMSLLNIDTISDVLNIVKEFFYIKNQLKGEVPKIVDNRIVINDSDITVSNLTVKLLDPSNLSNQLISQAIDKARQDELINDIKVIKASSDETIAEVPKRNFSYYQKLETKVDIPEDKLDRENVTLIIRSPVLDEDKNERWKFIRNGEKISANIIDEKFLSKVKIGESFSAGDTLDVELLTKKKYDQMYGTFINPKYTIRQVYQHNKKPLQLKINFDE